VTSEVVVMNRLGIALASDSAATVYVEGRDKIYHADKVFMLSHVRPVGAMVFNNSSLLGVPWETILKMFRQRLGSQTLPTLESYGLRLLEFIDNNQRLFPQEAQDKHYLQLVEILYRQINGGIHRAVGEEKRRRKKDGVQREAIAARVIAEELKKWRSKNDVTCFDPQIGKDLAGRKSSEIHYLQVSVFKGLKLSAAEATALTELAALVVSKDHILHESRTGLVVAGFGEDEHFPVMQEFEIGEVFANRPKFKLKKVTRIDTATESVVETFAEDDMVRTFLDGISPKFDYAQLVEVAGLAFDLPEALLSRIRVSKSRRVELRDEFRAISKKIVLDWRDAVRERVSSHLRPILSTIEFLPKDELAHVAASLVNLNSLQKRMSIQEDETVGGPIDVAVISKGDGFVWIDRKHYFRRELNPHFFKNYGTTTTTLGEMKHDPHEENDASSG
jgi:hypothetical protein